jgi:NADP-dependent 3-hydroxy acid dehydrogenase YdfG
MKTADRHGASAGIGRAVAERMLAAGWHVGLVARRADLLTSWPIPTTAGPWFCRST